MECWGHQAGLRERCLRFQTCLLSVSPHSQQIQGKEENDVTVTMKMLLEFLFFFISCGFLKSFLVVLQKKMYQTRRR